MTEPGHIDIVAAHALHERLGLAEPFVPPAASHGKPFTDWKMEIDDAPILRYLYRHLNPSRHLEFGTWEGAGVLLCLEESQATVWTINPFEGERTIGCLAYASSGVNAPRGASPIAGSSPTPIYQTDAGVFIGHKYRSAGLGHRVCQIYCDSRDWDISAYPAGFFDSALIDGGHTPDVVLNDTEKAMTLVRPGGMLLWHDFCPDPSLFDSLPSVAGVVDGLTREWPRIAAGLRDAFWVQPSFLLVGIR